MARGAKLSWASSYVCRNSQLQHPAGSSPSPNNRPNNRMAAHLKMRTHAEQDVEVGVDEQRLRQAARRQCNRQAQGHKACGCKRMD